jgi:SAM-dependent methyltransferase
MRTPSKRPQTIIATSAAAIGLTDGAPTFRYSASHRLPRELAQALLSVLRQAPEGFLVDSLLNEVRSRISAREIVDYRRAWAAFSYLYFGANFAKAYLATLHLLRRPVVHPIELVDLGCGSGAATAGVVACLRDYGSDFNLSRVVAIDLSKDQLRLFGSTTGVWLHNCWPKLQIDLKQMNLIDYLQGHADLGKQTVIASYVMTELSEPDKIRFRNFIRAARPIDSLIIESAPGIRGLRVERPDGSTNLITYDSLEVDLSFLDELGVTSVQPHLAMQKFSEKTEEYQLLQRYINSWENHDVGEIRKIFHRDAVYEILGGKVLHGRGEIEDYWQRNKANQSDLTLQFFDCSCAPGQVTVNWNARFYRLDKRAIYKLSGIMRLTISDGYIHRLTEAYTKNVTSE